MAVRNSSEYFNFYEELPAAEAVDTTTDADEGEDDVEAAFDEVVEEDSDETTEDESEESEEETDSEDESEEAEEEDDKSDTKPKEDAPKSDEEKKAFNKDQAAKRLQAKAEREATLQKQQQDYIAEADKDDPRDLAVRQLQVDAYNNKVDGNTNKLTNGYERAIKDFDILGDQSPEIQAEVNAALDSFQAIYVSVDQYGNPTEVRGDLYKYLQAKADSITKLTGIGATKQIKSKDKEKSKVLTTPNRAPKKGKEDPALDGFDEEAKRY